MIRIPTHRAPTHPGEMLREEFLGPMGLTQKELAEEIHVPYQRINEIVNSRRGLTPSTALRLAKFFGMSADFWMNLQLRWDLYRAQQAEALELEAIRGVPDLTPLYFSNRRDLDCFDRFLFLSATRQEYVRDLQELQRVEGAQWTRAATPPRVLETGGR